MNKKKATSIYNFNFIFLHVSYLFVTQKMPKPLLAGNKLTLQALHEKKICFDMSKYQCLQEANLKEQKLIFRCFRPLSKHNGGIFPAVAVTLKFCASLLEGDMFVTSLWINSEHFPIDM